MTVERGLRGIAGVFILASVLLAALHGRGWLFLAGFVGLNLLQSAFSGTCPMAWLLRKAGFRLCGLPECVRFRARADLRAPGARGGGEAAGLPVALERTGDR